MKKRLVKLGKSDENIAEQYPNIFEGLQKDAGQNSWDARLTKKGKDWKLLFRYVPEINSLVIEDFGTTGMDSDSWIKYQSLWDTSKVESELGARGQGKFLFHYFSAEKLVLTETIDLNVTYRFSYGTSDEWDDETKTLNDFVPDAKPLNHQGTRIWIMNIRKEFISELLDWASFSRYIESTWWEIIKNFGATFIVDFDGVERKVALTEMPDIEKEKFFTNEKLEQLGVIRNLRIFYCRNEVPEHYRGISVQRGGMTILRMSVSAEENIRNRIYGYCNFDDPLELELKRCEQPNHFGFQNKRAWNHVREFIRKKVEDFVLEISPKREKARISEIILQEAVKLVNSIVEEYAPELLEGPRGPGGKPKPEPGPTPPPEPKVPVRIDRFRPNQRRFEYNETLIVDCELANETQKEERLLLEVKISHQSGLEKYFSRYSIALVGQSRQKIDIPLIDFREKADLPGRYLAQAILRVKISEDQIHSKSFTFYLHEEPPTVGKVFVREFQPIFGHKDGKALYFYKWRNFEITPNGTIYVIWDHADFRRVRGRATRALQKTEILLYLAELGISEAFRVLLCNRFADSRLDPEEIKKLRQTCDEMIHDAVEKVIQ